MSEVAPTTTNFTADQRHILGEVYRLILRWLRERLVVPADRLEQNGQAISELPTRRVAFQSVGEA